MLNLGARESNNDDAFVAYGLTWELYALLCIRGMWGGLRSRSGLLSTLGSTFLNDEDFRFFIFYFLFFKIFGCGWYFVFFKQWGTYSCRSQTTLASETWMLNKSWTHIKIFKKRMFSLVPILRSTPNHTPLKYVCHSRSNYTSKSRLWLEFL
jgi:hypothetical protein